MSGEEESYCRLCAEPTPKDQLISSEEDVAHSSKITSKLLWINIDISSQNCLPSTICFSCFDLLERTWSFLHNVRAAQQKLVNIFCPKVPENEENSTSKLQTDTSNSGKPVDKDWEAFTSSGIKVKMEPVEPSLSAAEKKLKIKTEKDSDDDVNNDLNFECSSTDSDDAPLKASVRKKKMKKKKKIKKVKFDVAVFEDDLIKTETEALPLDIVVNWDEYMCRCALCDASCKNIQSLRLHSLQIHESCCIFKCCDCGKVSSNFQSFVRHVRTHKKLRFTCEFCNKQVLSVRKHIKTQHNNVPMCKNCGANYESDDLLQEHLLNYAKSFKKRKREKVPEMDLKKEFGLKCEFCSKEFKSRSNLQQHKLVHSERSRDFACHVCGLMFYTKGTLSTHMMTHEDLKPYKCEFCPLSFRARGNLQSHISLHSDMKPFVCDKCGKAFRVKRHLKSHSIVHTDLMPYICPYCQKQFRFKTRLNLHLRQHTGAKPYTCIFCQRDFTNGSNFKKHMKRRHNIDTSKKRYGILNENVGSEERNNSELVGHPIACLDITMDSKDDASVSVQSIQTVSDVQT